MKLISKYIKSVFRLINIGITRYSELEKLIQDQKKLEQRQVAEADIEMLLRFPHEDAPHILKYLRQSKSQLKQDLFVLTQLKFKRAGFFVEFGAANGVNLSNTYLLEKEFGWTGILAEPAKCWHKELTENRSANIEISCVWKDSQSILKFNEADTPELSTISVYNDSDLHKDARRSGKEYEVNTISLNELLIKYNAPEIIDYLSIDTEGSEFEILNNFDFSRYTFQVITCEHNYSPMRQDILNLLSKNGYIRVYQELSKFDDWYIKSC